jgi:DNA-binding MurR/RpiR family transcriptional regulator
LSHTENSATIPVSEPSEKETVESRILAAFPGMSQAQQRISRFIVDNLEYVAFASTSDIAARTQSSPATVVRFCQALGYEGYPHLQLDIRDQVLLRRPAVQRFEEHRANLIPADSIVERVFESDMTNIELTAVLAAKSQLPAAASKVQRARNVLVVGDGLAASLVHHLAHSLQVIGRPAQGIVGGGQPLALAMAFVTDQDVVIGIGFWRNLRHVVEAIREAGALGATTIGITDSKLSPLALLPDYPLLVASEGMAHSVSPVAAMSLLNALIATLSHETPEQVAEALRLVDEAYARAQLLVE